MKYQFMKAYKDEFKIERMSNVFKVSRSGYYKFIARKPSNRARENERLLEKIATKVFVKHTVVQEFTQN